MARNKPDLLFGPGTSAGFTPAGIAGFTDLRPAAVVRELLQNSRDAILDTDEPIAVVRFRLLQRKTSDIPGIRSYRKAFKAAIKYQKTMADGKLPRQAELVVQTIQAALDQDTQDILSILDNGVGLNERRMNALLSDGVSAKGGDATGTYGNGHSVAIPASNLRYVLYGGVSGNGHKIGAGHAVLASHISDTGKKQKHPRAGDGFLVRGFRSGDRGHFHDHARGDAIPPLILEELLEIQQTSSHGTAVLIPAFNRFREDEDLARMVFQAAACNFFQAIEEKQLVIKVEDLRPGQDDTPKILDRSKLAATLNEHKEQKRTKSFLSGQRAHAAHQVLRSGQRHTIRTAHGNIKVKLLSEAQGGTRIDLCRNGMWIADDKKIPGFYYKFQDRAPFHAVLLLDSKVGGQLYNMVRDAEGPLHDSINTKDLDPKDATELRNAFGEIRAWLKEHTQELKEETYHPRDFLTLEVGDGGDAGDKGTNMSFWGTPTAVSQRMPDRTRLSGTRGEGPHTGTGKGIKSKRKKTPGSSSRPVLKPFFQAVSVPLERNRRRIHIECQEGCENAELRLCVDEHVDATCDRVRQDEITPVLLSNITVDGQKPKSKNLVRENGEVVGLRLGDLDAGASVQVESDCRLAESPPSLAEPSLRVEVYRAPSENTSKKTQP